MHTLSFPIYCEYKMMMQLWRPELELDGINLGSCYCCLPIRIYHW